MTTREITPAEALELLHDHQALDRRADDEDLAILRLLVPHAHSIELESEEAVGGARFGQLTLFTPDEQLPIRWDPNGWCGDMSGDFAVRWLYRVMSASAASSHPYRSQQVVITKQDEERAWVPTFGGRKFHLITPSPDDVHITDIAQHLGKIARYCGATRSYYSVAQHSVMVSQLVPEELAMVGLLHDAAEAYCGDVTAPLKHVIGSQYRDIERRIAYAIGEHFFMNGDVLANLDPAVKHADMVLRATEKRDLLLPKPYWGEDLPEPMDEPIVSLDPDESSRFFMARFIELRERMKTLAQALGTRG